MDSTEIHYLTYDPEEIWTAMQQAYVEAGGDILYPGDEKEMLLRSVQSIITQAFAGVDNALRMQTIRYAVGEYLDLIGESRGCYRISAKAAGIYAQVTTTDDSENFILPVGTAMTADGKIYYLATQDFEISGAGQTTIIYAEADRTGNAGNAISAGNTLFLSVSNPSISSIVVTQLRTLGTEKESDEAYRDRIRTNSLTTVTTGPYKQYEGIAKAQSNYILDVKAINGGSGRVNIAVLISPDAPTAIKNSILTFVEEALNDETVRPLTDFVIVNEAEAVNYTLNVEYTYDGSAQTLANINNAVAEYKKWQDGTIGIAFNPDRFRGMLYAAGATLVEWGEGSNFDGETVEYTIIQNYEYCKGTITMEAQ